MTEQAKTRIPPDVAERMREWNWAHPPIPLPTYSGEPLFGDVVAHDWLGYGTGGPVHVEVLWRLTAALAELTSCEQSHQDGRAQELVWRAEDCLTNAEGYLREALHSDRGGQGQPAA